jgi:hypothetical protein
MIQFQILQPCDAVTGSGRVRNLAGAIIYELQHVIRIVAEGFPFDGASIPFVFWWWCRPFSAWVICAAAIHDDLYRGAYECVTRYEADRAFLLTLCDGARRLTRWRWLRYRRIMQARAMYRAVRVVGDIFWRHPVAAGA